MAQTWNRGSAFVALIAQGVLAFGILLSAAIDIGFAREAIKEENDDYSYNYDDYYYTSYEYSTGPSEYPYGFTLLLISIATLLTFIITFFLVSTQKAPPMTVAGPDIFWAVAWLALFAYGIYEFHLYGETGCIKDNYNIFCRSFNAEFAAFILTPFEFIATILVIVVAFQAKGRRSQANGLSTYYPQMAYGPQSQMPPQPQPTPMAPQSYPQYQQQPGMASSTPVSSPPQSSGPFTPPPQQGASPQPFYQNGQWYHYQPAPIQGSTNVAPEPQMHPQTQPQPNAPENGAALS